MCSIGGAWPRELRSREARERRNSLAPGSRRTRRDADRALATGSLRSAGEREQASVQREAAHSTDEAASRFGKRRCRTEHETAQARARRMREQLADVWGAPPRWNEDAEAWVQRVTRPRTDADPRVTEAEREHRATLDAKVNRSERERNARLAAYARLFGRDAVLRDQHGYLSAGPLQQAKDASQTSKWARDEGEAAALAYTGRGGKTDRTDQRGAGCIRSLQGRTEAYVFL
jgi:hypothetical protein